ncbi:WD40 repeat domain-containing protein [bacterium]|nr:WD40 repeat domain-containing protein [bacterium]
MPRSRQSLFVPAVFAALLAAALHAHADPDGTTDPDRRYYAAAMVAAGTSLQLHDVVAARHWLEEAPAAHRGWEWDHLWRELDRSARVVAGAEAPVTDLQVSPDGRLLAVCAGNDVVLRDARTGDVIAVLAGHTKPCWNARFSPDGARLASVSSDGTLRVWEVGPRLLSLRIDDIGQGVAAVAWRPDGAELCTVSWRREAGRGVYGVVDIWDAATGVSRRHLEHGVKPIGAVNYAPDGRRLWLGTWDFDVAAYDVADGARALHLLPPEDPAYKRVNECRLSPDGTRVAVAHDDGVLRVWDAASGALLRSLHRQAEGARLALADVAWLADGRRLATAAKDLTVRLWDIQTGDHLAVFHGHAAEVTALAATPDGLALWSSDAEGTLRRWDLAALDIATSRWSLPHTAYGVSVTADGRRAAVTGWGGWAAVFDVATGTRLRQWEAHGESGVRATWSPGDSLLATTGNDGLLRLWDMRAAGDDPAGDGGGRAPRLVREHALGTQSLAAVFSADSRWLAAPAQDRRLPVWAVADGAEAGAVEAGAAVSDAAWHPARPLLAACDHEGVVRVRDQEQGRELARLEGHGRGALQAAFSPDGAHLAAASASGRIVIWETAGWSRVREMHVAGGGQLAVAYSPDGGRLATCGADDHVHVWDPATGAHLLKIPLAESPYDLAWTPDGKRLLVLPQDGTLRVLE